MPKASRGGQRSTSRSNAWGPNGRVAQSYSGNFTPQQRAAIQQGIMTPQQAAAQNNAAPTPAPNPVPNIPTPSPAQVAQGNIMPAGGVSFKSFEALSDDKKADVIKDALKSGTPMFLDDSGMQKFAYFTGMNDKPTIVTEAQLNSMPGTDLWRSVRSAYKGAADVGYSSSDIYNQIAKGDYTNYSDTGGSVYGKAIYFDTTKGSYGSGKGYTVMHAKFAKGAKIIDASKLSSMYQTALSKGDKLALACQKADSASRVNLYGLAKGYDAKVDRYGYRMVFNRRCLVLSDTTF